MNNEESEYELLGALVYEPSSIATVIEKLRDEHFFNSGLRLVWQQVRADYIASKEITFALLGSRLLESGAWAATQPVVAELSSRLTPSNYMVLEELLESLEASRLLRGAIQGVQDLTDAVAGKSLSNVREATRKLVDRLVDSPVTKGATLHEMFLETVDDVSEVKTMGLPMGLPWLDEKTGGLIAGNLIVIAAPRGGGKSALSTQIFWETVMAGHFCGFYSMEMSKRETFQRLCCLEGIRSSAWLHRRFTDFEVKTITRVGELFERKAPLRFYSELYTLDDIAARIRLDTARFGMRLAVVDYIQRVKGDKSEGREREVSGIAWELKQLAMSLGITIIAPSQLNADLQARESRDIENHCDKMFLIAQAKKEGEEDTGRRLLKIMKNRNGPSEIRCLYQFEGEHYRFKEIEETDADITPAKQRGQPYKD